MVGSTKDARERMDHVMYMRSRFIVLTVSLAMGLVGFIIGGGGAGGSNSASPTYSACLKAGQLSQVSTRPHNCPSGYSVASWGSVGPQGPAGGLPSGGEYLRFEALRGTYQGCQPLLAYLPEGAVGPQASWTSIGGPGEGYAYACQG